MRYLLLFIFLVSISHSAHCQKRAVTFYDSAWSLTSKERGVYYRVGIIDTVRYQYYGEVAEFYKSGKRLMRGNFKASIKQDTFYFYYPSGQLETKGVYQNNLRKGIWTNYYESGKIKERLEFDDLLVTVKEYYDENDIPKVIDGNGEWRTAYFIKPRTLLAVKGLLSEGRRTGVWTYQLVNMPQMDTTLYCTETFRNGKFVSGKLYAKDKRGQRMDNPQMLIYPELNRMRQWGVWENSGYAMRDEYPYLKFLPGENDSLRIFPKVFLPNETYDVPPSFRGGLQAMSNFVGKTLKYPGTARSKGQQGIVVVSFVINADGTIEKDSVKVALSAYPALDDEAVRVIKLSPPWIPATKNGKPVRCTFEMPIKFKIS